MLSALAERMAKQIFAFIYVLCGLNLVFTFVREPLQFNSNLNASSFETKKNYRLPNDTKPEAYNIFLATDIDQGKFGFAGSVKINLTILQPTNSITIHARQLKIHSSKLTASEGLQIIPIKEPLYDPETEFLTFETENVLRQLKQYTLEIEYSGTLREDLAGFYRSSYTKAGREVWLATTHFEATNARHAFPCYDEPALKALFEITIEHGSGYTAISNMPEVESHVIANRKRTTFGRTLLMSTYLIAMIVSDFPFKSNLNDGNVFPYRVFAQPMQIENTAFALDEGEKIMNALSNYLKVPFKFPKMDQAAIPDFAPGAMENWGLVIYSENAFLYNASFHSVNRKRNVVETISHEFAHQWFGNLVSPQYWNFLWLNEGFATLFQMMGTDMVHPEWNLFDLFVTGSLQSTLIKDALNSTRSMSFYTEDPKGIQALFDYVSYQKASCVIRMFLHALKEDTFRKGLSYYFQKRGFKEAAEDDLFNALDYAAKEDGNVDNKFTVNELFGSWSNQAGYPLLIVTRNYDNNSISLSQERYTVEYPNDEANQTSWWIPYNYDMSSLSLTNDTYPNGWLSPNEESETIAINGLLKDDWILFNKQQTGYYRVMYDANNYNLLLKQLLKNNTRIHAINRAQIIDDLRDFILSGRLTPKTFFDFIQYMKNERKVGPWISAERAFSQIRKILLEGSKEYKNFKKMIAVLVESFYREYSIHVHSENETDNRFYSRETATNIACDHGLEQCLNESEDLLLKAFERGYFLSPNNRALIIKHGIRNANYSVGEFLWTQYEHSQSKHENADISTSYGHLNDEGEEILSSYGNMKDVETRFIYLNRTLDSNLNITKKRRDLLFKSIAHGSQSGLLQSIKLLYNRLDDAVNLLDFNETLDDITEYINSHDTQNEFMTLLDAASKKNLIDESKYEQVNQKFIKKFDRLERHRIQMGEFCNPRMDKSQSSSSKLAPLSIILLHVVLIAFMKIFANLYDF